MWGSSDGTTGSATAFNKVFDRACDCSGIDAQSIISCSDIALPDPSVVDDLHPIRETRDNEESTPKRPKTSDDKPSITFVTGNKKKLEEVKRILSPSSDSQPLPFQILNQKIDLPELQGDVLEIAREKCALAAKQVGSAVITEDTSLCFNALHDMPGPYIKWFLDQCGHTGLNNMIAFSEDKSGYAQTVVGFCPGPGKDVVVFDGRTKGTIVPARGPLDFGWDPIFQPDEGSGQTYAEMSKESKDAISHRSRAFSKMRDYLLQPTSSL
jgi:inosine triphosphate pyrophosphatase